MPDRSIPKIIVRLLIVLAASLVVAVPGCSSLPDPQYQKYSFPNNAYIGDVSRPYKVLGPVRSKVDYQTLDPSREEKDLCRNYFNKAARQLVKYAKKQGADAVIDVKSVVFLFDGHTETYSTPECSDDGGDGQVLAQGIAVKWKGAPAEGGAWTQSLQKRWEGGEAVKPEPAPSPSVSASQPEPTPTKGLPPGADFATDPYEEEAAEEMGGRTTGSAPAPTPAPAAAAGKSTAPVTAPATADSDDASDTSQSPSLPPVTVQMQDYDPNKSLLSSPGEQQPGVQQAPASGQASNASNSATMGRVGDSPSNTASARRPSFADPTLAPGSFQRTTP